MLRRLAIEIELIPPDSFRDTLAFGDTYNFYFRAELCHNWHWLFWSRWELTLPLVRNAKIFRACMTVF